MYPLRPQRDGGLARVLLLPARAIQSLISTFNIFLSDYCPKILLKTIPIIVAVGFCLLLTQTVSAAGTVPLWVKDVAKWWSDDKITEKEFLNAIRYLIQKGYLVVGEGDSNEQIPLSQSTSTSKLLETGVQKLKEEDNEIALLYFNEALKREPNNEKALIDKGIATARTGKLDEAKQLFDQAIKLGEKKSSFDYKAVINAGIAISIYGNQSDAMKYFDRVILNADKVDQNTLYAAYVNKGIAFYEDDEFEKAIEQYDNALKINPGRLGAIVNKANALQELGRYDDALSYFEQAYKITPDPLRWKPTFVLVE